MAFFASGLSSTATPCASPTDKLSCILALCQELVYSPPGVKIAGIETSYDGTAAAIVEDGTKIISNVVASQIDVHARYGGVLPEVAFRQHLRAISLVVIQGLAGCS